MFPGTILIPAIQDKGFLSALPTSPRQADAAPGPQTGSGAAILPTRGRRPFAAAALTFQSAQSAPGPAPPAAELLRRNPP